MEHTPTPGICACAVWNIQQETQYSGVQLTTSFGIFHYESLTLVPRLNQLGKTLRC